MALTQVTNSVITSNTVIADSIHSDAIESRHIGTGVITSEHLNAAVTANVSSESSESSADHNLSNRFAAGSLAVFKVPTLDVDFIANDFDINAPVVRIVGELSVVGNVTATESFYNVNLQTLQVSNSNIVLNLGGTPGSAEDSGFEVVRAGPSSTNVVIAALQYATGGRNLFRIGNLASGTLAAEHDIVTFADMNKMWSKSTTTDGSNVISIDVPASSNAYNQASVDFALDGVTQALNTWVLNSNNSLQVKDATLPANLKVSIRAWYPISGT
jgi:hypothetical protein